MKSLFRTSFVLSLLAGVGASGALFAAPFTAGNLAVLQAAASANNTTAAVVEVSPASSTPATPVQTISVDGTTAPNAIRISGSATSTGYLATSADGSLLAFTGHNSTSTGVNANTLTARGVVTFNAAGTFSLATTYTGSSGNQTRCATSLNNSTWFVADQGGLYTNGTSAANPAGNFRGVKSFGGTVYIAQASSTTTTIQVATVSAATGGTATGLPGLANNAAIQDFTLIQSGDNGTAYDVLYVLSATSNTAGTIAKFSLVSGTWAANGTYTTAFGGFGLAASDNGNGALLYVSTGLGALTANSLLKLADTAGYNAPIAITTASNVTLYTAPAGAIIKGVAFAPVSAATTAPDLTVSVSAPAAGTTGASFNYTLSATNSGNAAASSVGVTFAIPAGLTFVSASGDNGFTAAESAGLVTFSGGTLNPANTATLTVTVTPTSAATYTAATGAALIDPTSSIAESNETNNSSPVPATTVVTSPTPAVNLSVNANVASEAAATVITVTATSGVPVSGNQTVTLAVTGTGITSGDYTLSGTTLTILDGASTGSVTFTIADDILLEGTETATLTISAPSAGITLGATTTQSIVITDNDTSLNLANYVRIGRYDLPEPTRTTAPANNLLCQEASGVTYNWDTDTLFVACDGGKSVTQVSKTGALIDTMTLALGGSPQGTEFYDTEGITYVGGGKFVFVEERDRQVVEFTYAAGTTLTRAAARTVDLGTFVDNIGIEGLSYDPQTGGFICVKEISPQGIFQTGVDFNAGTATNGSATTVNSTNLFDPALAGMLDFADVFALSNLPALNGLPDSGNLLVLSQESARIVNIDRTGNISSSLQIVADPGSPLSAPAQQHEGLTMDRAGVLYVVNENGGGDIDHPQLWVYAPSTVPNTAPSAVALNNAVTSILENTPTLAAIKVADIVVTDDGLGVNNLTVTGADAAFFQITGAGLYLKAGTILDYETKTGYNVTVNVDDASLGSTPDATVNFTLFVTDVVDETPVVPSVFISEIHPTGSSSGTYNADWFELTNNGASAVDITGWQMDDNSNGTGKLTLRGVTSIPAGKSAIFFEGVADGSTDASIIASFCTAWFGSPTPPAGFLIGAYGGAGAGLSSSGDAVNVFDSAGVRVAGVAFGTSTTGTTFDNHAGLSSTELPLPNVSLKSVIGKNGAFRSANNAETGSPGTTGKLLITEVAPWSSGTTPLGADWFEVTNTSATAIDITGWKMDDNSETFAGAVALNGITSIAAGESVIFLETSDLAGKSAVFLATWFGTHVPAGLRIGSYTGSGVGLSGSGDAVNLFDAAGVRRANVAFGASTTGVTFDNAAGLDVATISTLSAVGTNGAFVAANDPAQIGSPGTATVTTSSLTPAQIWRKLYFGTTANAGLTADAADFDGDGVANLLEYALGGEPTVATTAEGTGLLPVGTVADASDALLSDRLSLAFVLDNPNPSDLTYTIEATADLVTWDPVASKTGSGAWTWLGGGTSHIVTSGTSAITVKVGDLVPTVGNPRRMMRLKVTAP
jgi:uncharacterized repeat protein (TIGR01451 family)